MGMLLRRNNNRVGVTTTPTLIPEEVVEPKEEVKVTEEVKEVAPVEEVKTYTRTEINRMTTAELKALAKSEGLDDSLSGNKLKDVLIKHFGI